MHLGSKLCKDTVFEERSKNSFGLIIRKEVLPISKINRMCLDVR